MANWDAAIERAQPDSWTEERIGAFLDARPDVLHHLIYDLYDVVKTEEERERGEVRMGRRPRRRPTSWDEVWQTIMPDPFSMDPFPDAMVKLLNGRSQRQFARKVPCHQATLSRLISGQLEPDLPMLESIAMAAGVAPAYFLEWRAKYLGELITRACLMRPNISVTVLKRVHRAEEDSQWPM